MQLEIGSVKEGKIIGITKFGAFVEIEKGVTGLVHISEISKNFVTDISKLLKIGDIVKVKILSNEKNKLSLSIKQVQEINNLNENNKKKIFEPETSTLNKKEQNAKKDKSSSFEDMLAKFKKNSEEKISNIRKNLDNRRGSYSKKRWFVTYRYIVKIISKKNSLGLFGLILKKITKIRIFCWKNSHNIVQ